MALLGLENNIHFPLQGICAYIKALFSVFFPLFFFVVLLGFFTPEENQSFWVFYSETSLHTLNNAAEIFMMRVNIKYSPVSQVHSKQFITLGF